MRSIGLEENEKIILWSQGTLWVRDSWQQGYCFLTTRRIIFNHVSNKTFEISLNKIIKLSVEKRVWFFGVRIKQLCIDFKGERGQDRAFIVLGKPRRWNEAIKDSMTLMLAERGICNGTKSESASNSY